VELDALRAQLAAVQADAAQSRAALQVCGAARIGRCAAHT
jgi:hypothetical protein